MNSQQNQIIPARVVQGHRVASGLNENPRFPGGTLRMQIPFFRRLGFDITPLYRGTLNVSIAPLQYRVARPRCTFSKVKWHPIEPAEDFSFFDVRVLVPEGEMVDGFIYYPHPETKPEHFQAPDVLELLLPFLNGIKYGMELSLEIPSEQMTFAEQSIQPVQPTAAGTDKTLQA
jgi:CTP-dependent riboflavin kinase